MPSDLTPTVWLRLIRKESNCAHFFTSLMHAYMPLWPPDDYTMPPMLAILPSFFCLTRSGALNMRLSSPNDYAVPPMEAFLGLFC